MRKIYPNFEEAKRIVQEKGLKSQSEYHLLFKELGLPSNPQRDYKGVGWVDWYDFLGKEAPTYLSYEDAKRLVQEKGVKSGSEYKLICKEYGLPVNPETFYAGKGWIDWYVFLGKEAVSYPSYEEASRIVQENGIKSFSEYRSHCKELGLTSSPHSYYKGKGWVDWYDFFGKKAIEYPSYEEAKIIVQENGITSLDEYHSSYKEFGLPSSPHTFYKDEGWIDYYTFFGKPQGISIKKKRPIIMRKLSLFSDLLKHDDTLKSLYMFVSQFDGELGKEIDDLLSTTTYEDRLNWVKEQLRDLKEDTPSVARSSKEVLPDELSAVESIIEEYDDVIETLPEEDKERLNTIWENYVHSAINRDLIAEHDG